MFEVESSWTSSTQAYTSHVYEHIKCIDCCCCEYTSDLEQQVINIITATVSTCTPIDNTGCQLPLTATYKSDYIIYKSDTRICPWL